eukprot:m.324310 g.324310  ORF g.324310 m.324310 type:complete len:109 (+) comp16460_c0_seq5:1275-1601(+)
MKIEKVATQEEQEKPKSKKQFLDDHLNKKQDFGQSLVDSIHRLISESKEEGAKKPAKKKKKMTPAQLEQCRKNLAKGRETPEPKPEPKVEPMAEPPQNLRVKLTDLLF